MKNTVIIPIIAMIIIVLFSGCIEENSKKIIVDDNGNADYTKIQNAIDNASPGYTIMVKNGAYYETLIINKSINLIGEDKENTIINCVNTNTSGENQVILVTANNCSLQNFKIIGTIDSLHVSGINVKTSDNTISNNILVNNEKGIYLNRDTNNNNVSFNTCKNNTYGIYIFVSYYSFVFKNNITNNFNGLRIINSKYNRIFHNFIENNQQGALVCCGSENNVIYSNNFVNNSEWNAQDKVSNEWDNGILGNFWDDYTGIDTNHDGIGDLPYNLEPYPTINKDRFPLMNVVEI